MSNYIERYWRDAKPEDAIKEPPMVARFDNDKTLQGIDRLTGFRRLKDGSIVWYAGDGRVGVSCQVYDAPDPGEGYRLIDPSLEEKRDGVEYLSIDGVWKPAGLCIEFQETLTYRRRIDPTVTYVPFTWEDREQLRGRWVEQVESSGTEQMVNKLDLVNGELFANNKLALELLTGWRFIDTGKPVGKEVTQ